MILPNAIFPNAKDKRNVPGVHDHRGRQESENLVLVVPSLRALTSNVDI